LITDHVSIYNIRKDAVMDAMALADDWGIRPDQVVDFQALVGDKVDNVPGVPLIGPKIACELLTTYGTLDAVLDNAANVKGAKRSQNLMQSRAQALLSRQLVRLDDNVPVVPDWNAGRVGGFDHNRLGELCGEFGFRSFGDQVARMSQASAPASWDADYRLVDTPEKLREFAAELAQQQLVCLDTETTNVMPRWAEIVGYSFAWQPGTAYYLPVRGPAGDTLLDPAETARVLQPLLEDPRIAKIGQNLKYDVVVLRSVGIELAGVHFDTMVASYLLDAGERNHNLDDLSKRYLNHTTIKINALLGRGKKQKRMDEVPVADVGTYAAEDADVPLRLMPLLAARLDEEHLAELNDELEVPLIEVLAELETNGIRVDAQRLAELSTRFGKRIVELACEIEELAGHPLNIASPKQLGKVLFEELRLPVVKKTKTGPSTDASVLEELARQHPLPAKIVEFRQYSKLKNTYVDALPALIHPETGRVHASFNQVVAATGRLSSSDPNLQNIPIRMEEGRQIRSAFIPGEPGWKLLAADYSQIELRVLAHFCSDPALCEAFADDADVHTLVASQVFDVPLDEVTSTMRRGAKAVNFGVIYGQSPFGLARSLGISKEEAADFIDKYFSKYRGVGAFIDRTLVECRRQGYVKTILGRRRAIQGVREIPAQADMFDTPGRRQLNLPERTAVNTVIQGSAADLIKLAMIAISKRLHETSLRARMLLQIHDELVFEVAEADVEPLAELVRGEMMDVRPLDAGLKVPLKVDVKWGDNWADCEPWNE
jgi:DNA polymerase-1